MNYAIGILKDRIKKHQDEIWVLENIENVEMNAEAIFIENDIENHKLKIQELQSVINLILKQNEWDNIIIKMRRRS